MKSNKVCPLIFLLLFTNACRASTARISGQVLVDGSPLPGAVLRIQTTDQQTLSDLNGRFILEDLPNTESQPLSAWAPGYYIAGGDLIPPGTEDLVFEMVPLPLNDNPDYEWLSAYHQEDKIDSGENTSCENCHSSTNGQLPFDEWIKDAHSNSAVNVRFLTMYTGEDAAGNPGQPTQFGTTRDYGIYPLAPDPDLPYYGPGYQLDYPNSAGNCSACHLAAAAVNNPYGIDPTSVSGVDLEGITCDFCHKIIDAKFNPQTGLPFPNNPGVLSLEFLRPPPGHQVFIGPYDDVAPGEDTYSPLQSESQLCAACHFGVFSDTEIYNSFGEWLNSEYADPNSAFYQTCQDCHMPPNGTDHFALLSEGGLIRDPETIPSHKMLGITDIDFMRDSVSLTVDVKRDDNFLVVNVNIHNSNTGHHIPTDSPLRHLILTVRAFDDNGVPLDLLSGSLLPDWTGLGNPETGHYAGLPGEAYAKVLEEIWSQESPSGSYWNKTRILSDNRIPALETAQSSYTFQASSTKTIQVNVQLLYRRAFIELQHLKGWEGSDLLLSKNNLLVK